MKKKQVNRGVYLIVHKKIIQKHVVVTALIENCSRINIV